MNPALTHEIRLKVTRTAFTLDVDLALPAQGVSVLWGASGAGKTSILRCVAGLERGDAARIRIGNTLWQDDAAGVFLAPWRRAVGYVFQEASLFAHLSVRGNLEYGLRRSAQPSGATALDSAVDLLGLRALLARNVAALSGGERQRVALARALATQPQLLLLDEPLTALDAARRQDILPWLERIRDELRTPMLYVTHDAAEATRLADYLVMLENGKVKVCGPVAEVLTTTQGAAVLGEDAAALLQGQVVERDAPWHLARIALAGCSLWLRDSGMSIGQSVRVRVLARDVSVALHEPQGSSIQNTLPCQIEALLPDQHPSQTLVRLQCGEVRLLARVTQRAVAALSLRPGQSVWAQVKSAALVG